MRVFRNRRNTVLIIILLIILGTALYMSRRDPGPPVDPETDHEIDLFFSTQDAMYLQAESRTVAGEGFYRNVLEELIAGPQSEELRHTIPDGSEVLDLEHDRQDEILTIDFNEDWRLNHWGGSTGERLTIYSIVNTMTSLPEISEVKFLVEGREIESLAGHLDLTTGYSFSEDIIQSEETGEVDREEYEVEIKESDEEQDTD